MTCRKLHLRICARALLWAKNKKGPLAPAFKTWCPEEDSVTFREPGTACKRRFSNPRAKRAGALLSGLKKEKARYADLFKIWCPEEDSNLHSVATART